MFKNKKNKGVRSYFNDFLNGHIHHYTQKFDARPSFLLLGLLNKLFGKVSIPKDIIENIRNMAAEGQVIYCIKYRNILEFLFFYFSFLRLGLPVPKSAFYLSLRLFQPAGDFFKICINQLCYLLENFCFADPFKNGWFQEHLDENGSLMIFLVDNKYGYKRLITPGNDPMAIILNHQFTAGKPIFVAPLILLFSKKPMQMKKNFFDIFFGPTDNPGFLRSCFLFLKNLNKINVNMGTPVNLQEWQKETHDQGIDQPFELRKKFINDIDINRKIITGPVQKSRQQIIEAVLRDPSLISIMQKEAAMESKSQQAIRKKAYKYIDEIASDYKISYVLIFAKILSWIFNNLFDGIKIDPDSLETIKKTAKDAPLVYVPCHKSHVDYLVLSFLLLNNNMMIPHIAAGKNLNFWPVAPFFRHSGAFFMRRTFQGMELYAKVFDVYLQTLIKEGYPIEFFIEGGRSRTGKIIQPKLGLLSMLMQSIDKKATDDLYFVPTYIKYDRILEEGSYINELSGKQKQKENMGQLIKARKFFKRRYGNIFIKFAPPISLKEYLGTREKPLLEMNRAEQQNTFSDFSFKITRAINDISVVTSPALSASAILAIGKKGFEIDDYMHVGKLFYDYLQEMSISFSGDITDAKTALTDALAVYESRNIIKRMDEDDEIPFLYMDEDKRLNLEFYKNNIIHFLLPVSMLSACILARESFSFKILHIEQDIELLQRLFKYEFIYPERFSPKEIVTDGIGYMAKCGFINKEDETSYIITHAGQKGLSYFSNLIENYIESYLVAFSSLKYLKKGPLLQKDFLKKITSNGEKLLKGDIIKNKEALSKANYQNAILLLMSEHILIKKKGKKGNRIITQFSLNESNQQLAQSWKQFIEHFLAVP